MTQNEFIYAGVNSAELERALNKLVDQSWDSPVHTIGRGPTQAAAGNHAHGVFKYSNAIGSLSAGWVDISSPPGNFCTLHSGMVTVELNIKRTADLALTANTNYVLGTLAEEYFPVHVVRFPVAILMNGVRGGGVASVDLAGVLNFVPWFSGTFKASNDYIGAVATYRGKQRSEYGGVPALLPAPLPDPLEVLA